MLLELRARLSRRAKEKQGCETKNEAEQACEDKNEEKEEEQGGGPGGAGVEWNSSDRVRMLLKMLVALLFLLLIVSGDVELNPGPGLGEYM